MFVLLWLTTLLQFYVLRKLYEQYIIKRGSKFVISFLNFYLDYNLCMLVHIYYDMHIECTISLLFFHKK